MFAFGLQYGDECYCGSEFKGINGKANEQDCSMNCAGNSKQLCGRGWRSNVYVINEGNTINY